MVLQFSPFKKLQDLANSYRKRYDTKYAFIPPHLTLKPTFEATDMEISTIAEQLKGIAQKCRPFTMSVTKTKSFQPVSNTIYFKVELSEGLQELHDALNNEDFIKVKVNMHLSRILQSLKIYPIMSILMF